MSEILTQNLSKELTDAFSRAEFATAHALRKDAIHHFDLQGLPGKKNEEYRFTPITRAIEKSFTYADFLEAAPSLVSTIDPYLIPSLDGNIIVFVNGQYEENLSKIISSPGELVIKPLALAIAENAKAVEPFLTKILEPQSDPFAALNSALWQSGVFIHVPKNSIVQKPVLILHVHDATHQSVVGQTRVLAVLEEHSEICLVEKFDSIGENPVMSSVVEEIVVKEGAGLTFHKIQNDPGLTAHISNTKIRQSRNSRVNTFTMTLEGQLIRNNLGIDIDGEGCESHFYGLYLLRKNSLADNHTTVDHQQAHSFSNELYKGIMDGHSKGVFNGKIYVRPHAQKTNAFQSNRNILISDTSSINTKPQLEIWADDVKCSHGCTSGQLDDEAIFYLQSRGVAKAIARAMVLYAFAGEVLTPITNAGIRTYLDTLISERLQNNQYA
jgi:Fe-S cluster assembly protein SufD